MNTLAKKSLLFGANSGIYYLLLLGVGWGLIAGLLPPHEPAWSAEQVAAIYQQDYQRIRIGTIVMMFGSAFYMTFTGALVYFIRQAEGCFGVLTASQLMAGLVNVVITFLPAIWFAIGTFRPDRPIEITYLVNDVAWLIQIGILGPFMPVVVTVAAVALHSKMDTDVFPRWFGFFTLWVIVLFLPAQLIFFFKDGPFAWDGLIAFWLGVVLYAIWIVLIVRQMRQAIKQME